MKKADVNIGSVYLARDAGKVVRVEILRRSYYGGWLAWNLDGRCSEEIGSAARLRPAPKEIT